MTEEILEGLKIINSKRKSLEEEVNKIKPLVIAHFNNYIDEVINPSLPKGYSMPHETDCFYECGAFRIKTAQYLNTPHGPSRGLFDFDGRLLDLCIGYGEQTPWVGLVDLEIMLGE